MTISTTSVDDQAITQLRLSGSFPDKHECTFFKESGPSHAESRLDDLFADATMVSDAEHPDYSPRDVLRMIAAVHSTYITMVEFARRADGKEDPELTADVEHLFPVLRFIGRKLNQLIEQECQIVETDLSSDSHYWHTQEIGSELSLTLALCVEKVWECLWTCQGLLRSDDAAEECINSGFARLDQVNSLIIPAHAELVRELSL